MEPLDIAFFPGVIHAVVGENGAGKSTLVGILSGFVAPDAGAATLDGTPLKLGDPEACRQAGIELVHQHFTLVPAFTSMENLALPRLASWASRASLPDLAADAKAKARELGWRVDDVHRAGDQSVGDQQRLEILKALAGKARVILFDEPTAVLTPKEASDLSSLLRTLRDEGRIVVLIAHKLGEILAVADTITVLRKGVHIVTAPRADFDVASLSFAMVGEDLPAPASSPPKLGEPRLSLKSVSLHARLVEIDLEVCAGEIVGVGGVDGNGQSELAEVSAGIVAPTSGELLRDGTVGYVPQDRRERGLALPLNLLDNALLGASVRRRFARRGWLNGGALRAWLDERMVAFEVRASGPEAIASSLSGGNAQKIVLLRALEGDPVVLVVHNPTRGLDVRATLFVHRLLRGAAARGCAVLLVTTDLDELNGLAHRRFAMSGGRLRPLESAADLLGGNG